MYNCSLFDRFGCAFEQLYVMATPDEIKIAVLKSDILTLENGAPSSLSDNTDSGFNSYTIPPPPNINALLALKKC